MKLVDVQKLKAGDTVYQKGSKYSSAVKGTFVEVKGVGSYSGPKVVVTLERGNWFNGTALLTLAQVWSEEKGKTFNEEREAASVRASNFRAKQRAEEKARSARSRNLGSALVEAGVAGSEHQVTFSSSRPFGSEQLAVSGPLVELVAEFLEGLTNK